MKFLFNLKQMYEGMTNEYGEPLSDFMRYEDFVNFMIWVDFVVYRSKTGDFIRIDIDKEGVEDE